jgi:hypothetical protein
MWYRKVLADLILPDEPESLILKPKHRRGFHSILRQDWRERIPRIKQEGLLLNSALGDTYGEPNFIWGTTGWSGRYNKNAPTVEFQVSPEHIQSAEIPWYREDRDLDEYWNTPSNYLVLRKDVPPEDILAIHEPWHEDLKYVLENPYALEQIKKDPKQFLEIDQYEPVVRYLIAQGII